MADETRDTLMKIVLNGTAIPAECTAVIGEGDRLAAGFISASAGNGWKGDYFALQDFRMEVGLMGDSPETGPAADQKKEEALHEALKKLAEQQANPGGKPMDVSRSANEFGRFMTGSRMSLQGKGKSYSANLEPVSLTRQMDASSLTLFKACIQSTTLDSAVIIKRRGGGGEALRTYLRIELTNLLITDFNWDDDEAVKETIKFVCRKASVQYSVEKDDGTLQNPGMARSWSVLDPSIKV